MADINSMPSHVPGCTGPASPPVQEDGLPESVVAMVELLFFAYRDFVAEPDAILMDLGFGRAHHRVLHFVSRNPGLRVADLLGILKITKQSLARVLKQLVDEGYVQQETGATDRRERRLFLTDRGSELARRLLAIQVQRLSAALVAAGPTACETAAVFLAGVISSEDQERGLELVRRASATVTHEER